MYFETGGDLSGSGGFSIICIELGARLKGNLMWANVSSGFSFQKDDDTLKDLFR